MVDDPVRRALEKAKSRAPVAPFHPEPWQVKALNDTSPVMLLTGSAGGGKSRCAYEKIHAYMLAYPGSTALVTRKFEEDLETSFILAMESMVMGPDAPVAHIPSKKRFQYDNGSVIIYTGMKGETERRRVRSIGLKGGVDIALMEEGVEFEEEDFDALYSRMRGSAGPFRQIILCTNPDAELHWINVRLIMGGEASVHKSQAADNPHNPDDYLEILERTRGLEYQRMVLGLWVSGVGPVIDRWDDRYDEATGESHGGNVTLDAEYNAYLPVMLWVDDGYSGTKDEKTGLFTAESHPLVFLLAQERTDNVLIVFDELVDVKRLASEMIADLEELCARRGYSLPSTVDYDRAASHLQGEFRRARQRVLRKSPWAYATLRSGPSSRSESIKLLNQVCDTDENGRRMLVVHPRCRYTRVDFASWSYGKDGNPQKKFDHCTDACRYGVWNRYSGVLDADVSAGSMHAAKMARAREVAAMYREKQLELQARMMKNER